MRKTRILLALIPLVLLGCAASSKKDNVNPEDIEVFKKSFYGTVLHKKIEEFDREEPIWGIPFWTRVKSGVYVEFRVIGPEGRVRDFYDYTEEEDRMPRLKEYYREIIKGDAVVLDLGYVDEGSAKEQFDNIYVR